MRRLMTQPGVWVLGSTTETFRSRGLGVVVEYAGQRGEPVWHDPAALAPWQYTNFGQPSSLPEPDGRFELVLRQAMGTQNRWTINGRAYPDTMPFAVDRGKRYRLAFSNMSIIEHPMHLHGHLFELAAIDGVPTWPTALSVLSRQNPVDKFRDVQNFFIFLPHVPFIC